MSRIRKPKIRHYLPYTIYYRDPVTGKTKTIPRGYPSDGATGAMDIWSEAWWVHDGLCPLMGYPIPPEAVGFWERDGYWDDGTACTHQDSTRVLGDILRSEGKWFRARTWPLVVGPVQRWKQRNRDMTPIAPLPTATNN